MEQNQKTKTRTVTVPEVAEELAAIFENQKVECDSYLPTTCAAFAENHGDINAARLLSWARLIVKDGRKFDFFLRMLHCKGPEVRQFVQSFIEAKTEGGADE